MTVMKKEADGEHPASHYLVVEDPQQPSTWHLRVKDAGGKNDHGLMGAAWAALHGGYRGNEYSGPNKQEAIDKLKSMYEEEKMPMPGMQKMMASDFLFVELSGLTSGRPFDGLAAGTFKPGNGGKVTFKPEELQAYVDNTKAVIDSTKTASGEIVGLPIDMDGHDHKGGAGWITGVSKDPARDVLLFDVNWTAPGADVIKSGTRRFFSPSVDPNAKVIVGGSLTNYPASRNDRYQHALRPIELSQQLNELETSEMPAWASALMELGDRFINALGGKQPEGQKPNPNEGEDAMPSFTDLMASPEIQAELEKRTNERVAEAMKLEQRKAKISEFAAQLAGGSKDKPVGLANIKADEIVAVLSAVPEEHSAKIMDLMKKVVDAKIVDFEEHGSNGHEDPNKKDLPKEVVAALDSGELKLADLSNPILDLGNLEQYDLRKWQGKDK